jgi:MFS family permease
LAVIYLRRTLPESPRYRAQVQGRAAEAAVAIRRYSKGVVDASSRAAGRQVRLGLGQFLSNPRYLILLLGTAGCWFMFDYAFYGNTISTPLILKAVVPHASLITDTAIALLIFTVAAAPGYLLAFLTVDRIGHRRLQYIGFTVMGLAFLAIGVIPGLTTLIIPFVLVYGLSYFFTEFGPNTTTFLLASELYPVSARTTGHGISAGLAKVGAFVGTLTFPLVNGSLGLAGVMTIAAATAGVGLLLTRLLPEPSGKSLEELSGESSEEEWEPALEGQAHPLTTAAT